jgi:hypothetical protein
VPHVGRRAVRAKKFGKTCLGLADCLDLGCLFIRLELSPSNHRVAARPPQTWAWRNFIALRLDGLEVYARIPLPSRSFLPIWFILLQKSHY